jgi:hypothetical protein
VREALARSDRDFSQAPRRRRARAIEIEEIEEIEEEDSMGDRVSAFMRSYPLEIAVALLLTAAAGAIVWNALVLQTARHPAPFFASGRADLPAPLPPLRPLADQIGLPALPPAPPPSVTLPLTVPVPVPAQQRPAARDAIGDLIRSGDLPPLPVARPPVTPSHRPVPVVIAPPLQHIPQSQPVRSTIGDLIRLGDAPPIPPALVAKVEPSRLVTSGQRALAKLGYGPMKADGVLGPGTRQAIERFERDRRLTVTGDFTPRTARELAAASGLPVE